MGIIVQQTKEKQPREVVDYILDMRDWFKKVDRNDYIIIAESTVTVKPDSDPDDLVSGPTIPSAKPAIESADGLEPKLARIWLGKGRNGVEYSVTIRIRTNKGRVEEIDLPVFVFDPFLEDVSGEISSLPAADITNTQIGNWDTAFSWGNHADAGYLTEGGTGATELTELTDVTITSPVARHTILYNATASEFQNRAIVEADISDLQNYLTSETDPVFGASPAGGITSTQIGNWDIAFGWGDHAAAGYESAANKSDLTTPDTTKYAHTQAIANALATKLESETDPVFGASPSAGITSTQIGNWDAAFSWGDHAAVGYLTTVAANDLTDVAIAIPANRHVLVYDGVTDNRYENRLLVEADISDLQNYLTAEVNDLTAAVTWANVPDANITQTSVTQHKAALAITESQITDLGSYADKTATETVSGAWTLNIPTFVEYTETTFALSGTTPAIDPANGTIQTWTLSGDSTPTSSLTDGQSVTLMIDDGSGFTITWTMVSQWIGGSAPTLATTGFTVINIWNVGGTVYGAAIGELS